MTAPVRHLAVRGPTKKTLQKQQSAAACAAQIGMKGYYVRRSRRSVWKHVVSLGGTEYLVDAAEDFLSNGFYEHQEILVRNIDGANTIVGRMPSLEQKENNIVQMTRRKMEFAYITPEEDRRHYTNEASFGRQTLRSKALSETIEESRSIGLRPTAGASY
jgi:hypothetical protein